VVKEPHVIGRVTWLRAAVLGANDGIVSTASLMLGVASAHASHHGVLIAGLAGLAAGAMSMAAGEYVSVHSQADTEKAELHRETKHLSADFPGERQELVDIYVARGLDPALADQVADQLMRYDALGAHARDELGITHASKARPIQAAWASAASFAAGAIIPLMAGVLGPDGALVPVVVAATLITLAVLGALAAHAGGASRIKGAVRVTFWGALAMAVTAGVGSLFGTVVG
jgi:VIT1/CCC1 family predicted Fe2+/Mn2+ transporter